MTRTPGHRRQVVRATARSRSYREVDFAQVVDGVVRDYEEVATLPVSAPQLAGRTEVEAVDEMLRRRQWDGAAVAREVLEWDRLSSMTNGKTLGWRSRMRNWMRTILRR